MVIGVRDWEVKYHFLGQRFYWSVKNIRTVLQATGACFYLSLKSPHRRSSLPPQHRRCKFWPPQIDLGYRQREPAQQQGGLPESSVTAVHFCRLRWYGGGHQRNPSVAPKTVAKGKVAPDRLGYFCGGFVTGLMCYYSKI